MKAMVTAELHVPRGVKLLAGLMLSAVAGLHLSEVPAQLQLELYWSSAIFSLAAVLSLVAVFGVSKDKWGWGWVLGVLTCGGLLAVYLLDRVLHLQGFDVWLSPDPKPIVSVYIELAFIVLWLLGPSRVQSWYNYVLTVSTMQQEVSRRSTVRRT